MSEWGKHFCSMYEGSMVGKGAMVFALMGYIIPKMQCKWVGEGRGKMVTEGTVRLNVEILSTTFGEPKEKVEQAIEFLCSPDPKSFNKQEEGRRLIKISEFDYRVVNAPYYQNKRDKEQQREKTRERVAEWRERQKTDDSHQPGGRKK